MTELLLIGGAALSSLVALAVTIYLCYRFGERTVAFLGESGTRVLVQLSAFILVCIGVQIFWNGYSALTAAGP